jgi:hypothetical protein
VRISDEANSPSVMDANVIARGHACSSPQILHSSSLSVAACHDAIDVVDESCSPHQYQAFSGSLSFRQTQRVVS